jgi:hypothetical protein
MTFSGKRVLEVNLVLLQKGFDYFLSSESYRRGCFVTTAPMGLAVAADVKEIFLSFGLV